MAAVQLPLDPVALLISSAGQAVLHVLEMAAAAPWWMWVMLLIIIVAGRRKAEGR